MIDLGQILLLALIFFVISLLFSMVGLGGGILYVPILLFAGYTLNQAPGISLMLIMGTSLAALVTFWRSHRVDWKLALVIDPPTDIMAFLGGYFNTLVSESLLRGLLAVVLMVAGTFMLRASRSLRVRNLPADQWWIWVRRFRGFEYRVNLPLVLTATALIGVLSGMLGISGGIIKLPIMVLLCGVPMDIAVATSTVMVAVTALSGLAGHAIQGQVDWHTGLILTLAALAGGFLGGRVSTSMDRIRLQKLFGLIVWIIALRIAFHWIF
ncbi:MAG TPA: sulfite exporter TauE/SafE family protein [Thermoanaerobaculia bacterium]|nr:sulfite exporter TauE/SafE family protein [Thermoanaerobaculia bacterium]HUM30607.1 sulfite exporter TauE/SafE family protein [Thermoanaerobaculia bacterium]HXK68865.1 sulfite exporter TauE/SafE family protein [Thermoanaerobaculia bacterium]